MTKAKIKELETFLLLKYGTMANMLNARKKMDYETHPRDELSVMDQMIHIYLQCSPKPIKWAEMRK